MRVHPERPERVICGRTHGELRLRARAPRGPPPGFGRERPANLPSPVPSPRSKTASFGSRSMVGSSRLRAPRLGELYLRGGSGSSSASLTETATTASPRRAGLSAGDCARAPSDGAAGRTAVKCPRYSWGGGTAAVQPLQGTFFPCSSAPPSLAGVGYTREAREGSPFVWHLSLSFYLIS